MKIVLVLIVFTFNLSASVRADTLDYTFELTKEKNATLYLNIETKESYVEVDNRQIDMHISEESIDYLTSTSEEDEHVSLFTFDDINFDGYADIGVLKSYGTVGNTERIYYLYEPLKMNYKVYPYEIVNLELFSKERLLYSYILGSSGWTKLYKIDTDGMPFEMMEILLSSPEEEDTDFIVDIRACRTTIKASKVHFYQHPAKKMKKSYLIKGNSVVLKDFAMPGDGTAWVEVEYKSTKKVFNGWMRISDISFKACPVTFSAMVKDGVEKSYFYDARNGEKTKQYIVMYDQIDVLKQDTNWLKGRYINDENKETVGWLKKGDFEVQSYIQCCTKQ